MSIRQTMIKIKSQKGITLSEILVSIVIFFIFISALTAVMIMGLNYLKQSDININGQQNCRIITECVTFEMGQAIPDPDPGGTGYLGISPLVPATGILFPNANVSTGNYVEFTEPNPSNYDISVAGFDSNNPANYQRIKYYINNNILYRDIKTYNQFGAVASSSTDEITDGANQALNLYAIYIDKNVIDITVASTYKDKTFSLTSRVHAPNL